MIPTAKLVLLLNAILAFQPAISLPIHRPREVPQEHSHEKFLTSVRASLALNNPDGIVDPVFGLLGNAAAAAGLGKITDPDCLHQATADQAFTNAKAAGDVQGQVDALIYAALERNTGKVGLASVLCTAIKATNPEIAAISQHQDPASENAAATNKAITLELAKQIAAVGGDPLQALEAGTFAPGDLNDATGKGNTCDDANDPVGCIFTQNLLVPDATEDEINAAVAGVTAATTAAASSTTAAADAAVDTSSCTSAVTVTITAASDTASATDAVADTTTSAAAAAETTATAVSNGKLDFGSCSNPAIEFGAGFDGRKENSFQPVDKTEFNHGSAQNIGIVAQFICDRLNDQCKAPAATVDACNSANTAATALGKVAEAADTFNGLLGFTTDFASNPVGGAAAETSTAASAATATSSATDSAAAAATSAAVSNASTGGIDLGDCSNPVIEFGLGFDGRTENSFQPADKTEFNHGSALNIGIIASFVCDRLNDQCKAPASTVSTCRDAVTSATNAGKIGVAADIFNLALGFTTDFATNPIGGAAASAATTTAAVSAATTSAAAAASTTSAASAAVAGNLQTFTGALGGITAPPVTESGSGAQPFCVQGNACFSSKQNAVVRSCDVQHNQCANASNAAGQTKAFSVEDCGKQQDDCNALAQSA